MAWSFFPFPIFLVSPVGMWNPQRNRGKEVLWVIRLIYLLMQESPDPLFRRNRKILFHLVYISQLCKIFCQLMHSLNCFLIMKKISKWFYTVGEYGLDETISLCFYETKDPDSLKHVSFEGKVWRFNHFCTIYDFSLFIPGFWISLEKNVWHMQPSLHFMLDLVVNS